MLRDAIGFLIEMLDFMFLTAGVAFLLAVFAGLFYIADHLLTIFF